MDCILERWANAVQEDLPKHLSPNESFKAPDDSVNPIPVLRHVHIAYDSL